VPLKPNILWIQCDEIRADSLSCYAGNPWIRPHTPNVQQLADDGVVFENAFCPSPVCTPSRGCEYTSQHATTLGVYHNVTKRLRDTLRVDASWVTWPWLLRDTGYRAVNVGKLHVAGPYDIWDENVGCRQFPNPRDLYRENAARLGLVRLPGIELIIGGTYPLDNGDDECFGARQLTRLGLAKLAALRETGKPWLLRLSYVAPHTPVITPPPFDSLHDTAAFPFDPVRDRPHADMSAYERSVAQVQRSDTVTPDGIARARATYYGLVSAIDREIGLLLDAVRDNTIVLVTGDHGTMLGEMGLWQKQIFNRKVHQVPFIIRAPGIASGRRMENIDLLDAGPTLLQLCGVETPKTFTGRNLFDTELEGKPIYGAFGFGDSGSYMYEALYRGPDCPRRICVRSGPYRLDLSVLRGGKHLPEDAQDVFFCDTRADPGERINMAASPRYAPIVSELQGLLLQWHADTAVDVRPKQ